MEALAGLPGLLEEEHCLQGEDIGADQRLEHIDDSRMQHETLSQFQHAMRHVDALIVSAAFGVAQVRWRRWYAWHGCSARHHVVGELRQFGHFVRRDQAFNVQEAIAAEGAIVLHPHRILIMRTRGSLCHNHNAGLKTLIRLQVYRIRAILQYKQRQVRYAKMCLVMGGTDGRAKGRADTARRSLLNLLFPESGLFCHVLNFHHARCSRVDGGG